MDELKNEVLSLIEQNPKTIDHLCSSLPLWPKSAISRRLQSLRKEGHISFDKIWKLIEIEINQ